MKYLRPIGLLFSLLIVGVLGGLMSPVPSEAAPTLTLQVDSGTPMTILGASAACPTGFTSCYVVGGTATGGNPSQTYTVGAATGLLPRLNLTDIATQDQAKLTGIKIAPVVTTISNSETHVLTIVMTNTFSALANPAGYYVFAMRTGGYFQAGGSPLTAQYDYVEFKGTGTFCAISTCNPMLVNVPLLNVTPSTVNRVPLSLQVGNSVTSASFTLNQVTTYPTFNCKDANNQCTPAITLTYTVTLKGSDILVLSDSNDAIGVSCNLIPPGPPLSTPAIPCHKGGKAKSPSTDIGTLFAKADVVDDAAAALVGAVPGIPCTVDCPGVTDIGNPMGTITINKQVQCPSGCPSPVDFYFDISGPAPLDNRTVQLTVSEESGPLVVPVHSGGPYSVVEQTPPTNWALAPGTCNPTVPTDGNASCSFTNVYTPPLGSSYFEGNYYIVRSLFANTSWADARTAAQALGTGWDLAAIFSQDEQNFIQSLLPNLGELTGIHEYWIAGEQPSGSEEPGRNWQWATDQSVFYDNGVTPGFFANWGSLLTCPTCANEPNNAGIENHVALDNRYGWGWNDNDSNLGGVTLGYVAKKSAL